MTDEGAFYKRGFAGQILAVFPHNDIVIAYFGTNDDLASEASMEVPLREMVVALF